MTDHSHRRQFFRHVLLAMGAAFTGATLARAGSTLADSALRKTPSGDLLETVPKGSLPVFARNGGAKVQEAYRHAAEHGGTLHYIPCFCGCKSVEHKNNEDCYITERHADGRITFNSHSAG